MNNIQMHLSPPCDNNYYTADQVRTLSPQPEVASYPHSRFAVCASARVALMNPTLAALHPDRSLSLSRYAQLRAAAAAAAPATAPCGSDGSGRAYLPGGYEGGMSRLMSKG